MGILNLKLTSPHWYSAPSGKLHIWSMSGDKELLMNAVQNGVSEEIAAKLPGHWTLIDQRGHTPLIVSDRIRSHPIVYTFLDGTWHISDDIEAIRPLRSIERNCNQAEIFEHTGFAVGSQTLLKGILSTEAGSYISLEKDGSASSHLYVDYHFSHDSTGDANEFAKIFAHALDVSVGRMLESVGGRQLVIPLSGGLDSRLLAAYLRLKEVDNLVAFTYGKLGAREVETSRKVADELGIRWFSIPLEACKVRSAAKGREFGRFLRATWKGTSLPHIQDWYALNVIKHMGLVDDHAVFLPGHTIVGNMHDEYLSTERSSQEEVRAAITRHHASLQGQHCTVGRNPVWQAELERAAQQIGYGSTDRSVQELVEWFNLKERQAKYINNSMSAYELFGYSWALPMLDREMWQVWLHGSPELTLTRAWYSSYTKQIYRRVTGHDIDTYRQASIRLNSTMKNWLLAGMRTTGADQLLNRCRSIRIMMDHPMAFEAYSDLSRIRQLGAYLCGRNQMGLWTRSFVRQGWCGHDSLVPQAG